jgi:hypothetical protein
MLKPREWVNAPEWQLMDKSQEAAHDEATMLYLRRRAELDAAQAKFLARRPLSDRLMDFGYAVVHHLAEVVRP